MSTLVIYYSWTGKTELVAKAIAKTLAADIRKVEEVKERKGLRGFISGVYSARRGRSSEIKPMDLDLNNYELIFLGTPVWSLKPTPALNAFISQADFRDKEIILFVTMGRFGGKGVLKIMADRIKAKGGSVANLFAIKTGGVREEEIIKKGEELGERYRQGVVA
jgi:flavodoxin